MPSTCLGILHPGEMGISVAASALRGGHDACWASEGRSDATRARAEKHGLRDLGTVDRLCEECAILVSICPPHAAEAVARDVAAAGFQGLYLDANAISPERACRLGRTITEAGAGFVDGGIIGGPAWEPGRTWLYLSGPRAAELPAYFSAGPLETGVLGERIGAASALKMCYAAYTKGTTALLCAVLAASEQLEVRGALEQQWARDDPGFPEQAARRVRGVTAKAWRFEGEMREISATLAEAGLPEGFHKAAAEIYHRMANFKDATDIPSLQEVIESLIRK